MKVKDLDKEQAWSPDAILPPGEHVVVIDDAEEGTSSGGHDQVELTFRATDGSGQIRDWLVVIPSTYGKVKQLLDAVNIVAEGGEWELPTDQLPGKVLKINVREEPDRQDPSKTRTRVTAYMPSGETDVPADTRGLGSDNGSAKSNDEDLPF